MLRAFETLFVGFVAATLLALAIRGMLNRFAPGWAHERGTPKPGRMFADIGFSFVSAAAGGYVTAWAAAGNPVAYVAAFGLIVLVFSGLSTLQARGKQPIGFLLAQVALAPLGALAGGFVRLRVNGVLQ